MGIGWNDVEYQALGIDFRGRAARMEEQIPLLRRLWTEASVDHAGAAEVVDAAGLAPLPPEPVPIWIGCGTDSRAVARVGRLADGWLPEPTVQPGRGLEPALLEVRAAAAAAGRDPDTLGLEGQVWAPPDQEARLPDRLARWRDAGADAVGINTGRAGEPWSEEHLDALLRAADAMP